MFNAGAGVEQALHSYLFDAGAGVEQALHIWSSRVRANLGAWLAEVARQINAIR